MKRQSFSMLATATLVLAPAVARAQDAAPAAPPPVAAPPSAAQAPAPGPAPEAEPEEGFGKAGVINVASDLTLSIDHTIYSAPDGASPESSTSYSIGPAADYFVIDNLSVGGQVLFSHSGGAASQSAFRISPRVGYHFSFVPERLGLWPRLELGYETETVSVGGADITEKKVVLGVFVPLLIHPVEHFHIGIGPFLDTDLSAKEGDVDGTKSTTLGLRTEIGGWWGL
jgi:hypothetical protein